MANERLDAFLVTALPNVQYLTGFSGSAGVLLVTSSASCFFTDPRYDIQAHEEVAGSRVSIVKGFAGVAAAKRAARIAGKRIGLEADTLPFAGYRRLQDALAKKTVVPTHGWIEALRVEKDEGEIALIRQAVELGSRAFEETLPLLRPGITELEVAAEIEYRMRRYGGERPAFETIVASGPRAALPHARATSRKL
ncbi:MAG TPA: aminopeptidase P family N-terminal domain-containing protein, partial [Terriglobia bacterium]|nr:aminopeptidase P family N-terminal domain-containing protein [Terriglobia bacterium]